MKGTDQNLSKRRQQLFYMKYTAHFLHKCSQIKNQNIIIIPILIFALIILLK